MRKHYEPEQLWDFVRRADTYAKIDEAIGFLVYHTDVDMDLFEELVEFMSDQWEGEVRF